MFRVRVVMKDLVWIRRVIFDFSYFVRVDLLD